MCVGFQWLLNHYVVVLVVFSSMGNIYSKANRNPKISS